VENISEIDIINSELEFMLRIWDYYYEKIKNQENKEIPISLLLIKLMRILRQTKNKPLIKKALLITISFFHDVPADYYENRGIEIKSLPKKDRKRALLLLRQEFLLNQCEG